MRLRRLIYSSALNFVTGSMLVFGGGALAAVTVSAAPAPTDKCAGEFCGDPAASPDAKCANDRCDFIKKYVNPFINLLASAFGIIAVISLIFGGIQYSTSEGDPQKVSMAKKRILNTVIAIVAFFFLYGFLQFLVPGGIFNRSQP